MKFSFNGILVIMLAVIIPLASYLVFKKLESNLKKNEDPNALPRYWKIPDFSFVDQQGKVFNRDSVSHTIYFANFFFTSCPSLCPKLSANMERIQNLFYSSTMREPDFRMKLLSFSVDPEHDTPDRLQAYADKYNAHYYMWRFMTGNRDSIYSLSIRGFKNAVTRDTTAAEEFTHAGYIFLVDKKGWVRKYYRGWEELNKDSLSHDVLRLMVEKI